MSSIEPYVSSYHENRSKKDPGGFIVACGDGAELLEFGEEILDEVPRLVHVLVVGTRSFSVGLWWDDNLFSGPLQRFYDSFIGIKGFIRKNSFCRDVRQKGI